MKYLARRFGINLRNKSREQGVPQEQLVLQVNIDKKLRWDN